MPSTTCPVCGRGFRIDEDQALLYEQLNCPHCDANLEVIDESPVIVEEIDG